MDLNRDTGIDSLGIVSLILDIEEKLNIDLDLYLAKIRKCTTIKELAEIIQVIYEEK